MFGALGADANNAKSDLAGEAKLRLKLLAKTIRGCGQVQYSEYSEGSLVWTRTVPVGFVVENGWRRGRMKMGGWN
jgi:hypothetical protein